MSDAFENLQVKLFEALRDAIFRAASKSQDVRNLMQVIREHHLQDNLFAYLETIEIRNLMDHVLSEPKAPSPAQAAPLEQMTRVIVPTTGQYIDGRRLTLPEILFEEYCRARFNENTWLRHNKMCDPFVEEASKQSTS
jgi:hypothetical protein